MTNFSTVLLVVAVALLDPENRVLMQKRCEQGVHGGLWEFPGGKLEPGETARQAAVREMREELGLAIDPDDLEPLSFASGPREGSQAGGELVILLYTCRRWRGMPVCNGADEFAWLSPERLSGLEMPPLDYPLAASLAASCSRQVG